MARPHPGLGAWNTGGGEAWHAYGLLAPFERTWSNGVLMEDPAIVPWMRLDERPEGWGRAWKCGQPHWWWCLCDGCEAGTVERKPAPSLAEARSWFEWAASRITLESARAHT